MIRHTIATALVAATLALTACSNDPGTGGTNADRPLPTADPARRVDTEQPRFSNPTTVTNPYFPVSQVTQAIYLGIEESEPLRVEVTLLPETKSISWNDSAIDTVVAQYVAYRDNRILEVAWDWYAQADDGSVWYLGEDVDNYEDGAVADHDGSWAAGRDGPGGMIMPAAPGVGDVFRPENIPGFVFEEVTVESITETADGPRGPIAGTLAVRELQMDGATETKQYAPGYGEFRAEARDELVTLAVAVPTDSVDEGVPTPLVDLATRAEEIYDSAGSDWSTTTSAVEAARTTWDTYKQNATPPLLAEQTTNALDTLADATSRKERAETTEGANQLTQAVLDLQIRYRTVVPVDVARLGLWARQVLVDLDAGDTAGQESDVAILETIFERVRSQVTDGQAVADMESTITELRQAVNDHDDGAGRVAAERLRSISTAQTAPP